MNKRGQLALNAAMEGNAVVVRNIGDRQTVSDMELICLVNFAEIGLMSLFSELDGKAGEDAAKSLAAHLCAIRTRFANASADGVNRLSMSTAAMLRSERFQKYLVDEE